MRTGLLQWDIIWLDVDKNLEIIEKYLRINQDTFDVLILPEMFSTGFVMDTFQLQKSWQDTVNLTMTKLCREHHIHIMGSIPYFKNGHWFNTFCVWSDQGIVHQYDKIHLFSLAGENKQYAPGHAPGIFTNNHWKIAPFVCYDLRFPYLSFSTECPHILVYSANWPVSRISHWDTLLKARAVENQCYVVGVNRVGKDENGYEYPGNSAVYDFEGNRLLFVENKETCLMADLSMDKLTSYQEKLPFYKDRRSDLFQ